MKNARKMLTLLLAILAMLVPLRADANGAGYPSVERLPNLVPLKPTDIKIDLADDSTAFDPEVALRFTAAIANTGKVPLDILGFPRPSSDWPPSADAEQCIDWVRIGPLVDECAARQEVGSIIYHPAHNHWHYLDFVAYELRTLDENDQPDMGNDGLIGLSLKISFCLEDSQEAQAKDPEAATFNPNVYSFCSILSQGISPGRADVYSADLPGQQIPLSGIPDGTYALVLRVNPVERFLETSLDDNVAYSIVTIDGYDVSVGE